MYGKGRQGRHVTPLYLVSKAIWSQMQEKNGLKHEKIKDFTQFYQQFNHIKPDYYIVTEIISERKE